jgi:hypothetical protein
LIVSLALSGGFALQVPVKERAVVEHPERPMEMARNTQTPTTRLFAATLMASI